MLPDDVVLTGEQAERLLNDDVFKLAVDNLEARYTAAWRRAESPEEREMLHARTRVLADLQTEIRRISDAGKYEDAQRKRRGRPPKNPVA